MRPVILSHRTLIDGSVTLGKFLSLSEPCFLLWQVGFMSCPFPRLGVGHGLRIPAKCPSEPVIGSWDASRT